MMPERITGSPMNLTLRMSSPAASTGAAAAKELAIVISQGSGAKADPPNDGKSWKKGAEYSGTDVDIAVFEAS